MNSRDEALKLRDSLNKFRDREITANELAVMHPNCECENACSEEGSKGRILNNEKIRLFLSTRNFDVEDLEDLEEDRFKTRLFKERSISKVFKFGLSVCRVNEGFATRQEIISTIDLIYKGLIKDKECGGLFGHLDISVEIVRNAFEDCRKFCIYETPSNPIEGGFERPSHADIVWSKDFSIHKELSLKCRRDFQKLLKNDGDIEFWNVPEYHEFQKFLPKKIKKQLNIV